MGTGRACSGVSGRDAVGVSQDGKSGKCISLPLRSAQLYRSPRTPPTGGRNQKPAGRSVTGATTAGHPKQPWHRATKTTALLAVLLRHSLRDALRLRTAERAVTVRRHCRWLVGTALGGAGDMASDLQHPHAPDTQDPHTLDTQDPRPWTRRTHGLGHAGPTRPGHAGPTAPDTQHPHVPQLRKAPGCTVQSIPSSEQPAEPTLLQPFSRRADRLV